MSCRRDFSTGSCGDMDDNLRELGTSDMKVPKKMREFGDAFYGRTGAYDAALGAGREPLAAALSKNISLWRWTSRTPGVSLFMSKRRMPVWARWMQRH